MAFIRTTPIHNSIDIYRVWLNIYDGSYGTAQMQPHLLPTGTYVRTYLHALYASFTCTHVSLVCEFARTRISFAQAHASHISLACEYSFHPCNGESVAIMYIPGEG